jgi:hypothetical protein
MTLQIRSCNLEAGGMIRHLERCSRNDTTSRALPSGNLLDAATRAKLRVPSEHRTPLETGAEYFGVFYVLGPKYTEVSEDWQ